MRALLVTALAAAIAMSGTADAQPGDAACGGPLVNTSSGPLCGLEVPAYDGADVTVQAFLGVPYAETTAGANRWRPPVPRAPWTAPLLAHDHGPPCPQAADELLPQRDEPSEDCLHLSVWTPAADGAGRPVIVYLYGGAFVNGSTVALLYEDGPLVYDGARLAATQDVVVVTLNYRVGALGFLAGVGGLEGNYGLRDQQLAMRWVKENAAAFGGDPERVTLAGQSAGAMSVTAHLTAVPSSTGLFSAAIVMSNPAGLPYKDMTEARRVGEAFARAAGCPRRGDPVACLRALPVEEVLETQTRRLVVTSVLRSGVDGLLLWSPVVDGEFLVGVPIGEAFASGYDVPAMIGTTTGEGVIFGYGGGARMGFMEMSVAAQVLLGRQAGDLVMRHYSPGFGRDQRPAWMQMFTDVVFRCPSLGLALAGSAPTYVYEFEHLPDQGLYRVPACAELSCHSQDVPYVFGVASGPRSFTPAERELSGFVQGLWGAFAHDPHGLEGTDLGGGSTWPRYQASDHLVLALDLEPYVREADLSGCDVAAEVGLIRGIVDRLPELPDLP
ncbi:MAG TPA: carboxylesterase family protein [Trueperaceae bacterium]|nr:carboxylesterase family protein [Trueperaceae bacterium]